jgi:hypothetical protein
MAVYQLEGCARVCLLTRLSLSELMHVSGLVRSMCERSTDVMLLAKRDHVSPLRSLFGDLTKTVRFQFVDDWDDLTRRAGSGGDSLLDRLQKQYRVVPLPSFREACPYAVLGLPQCLRETEFRLHRDLDREGDLCRRVAAAVGGGEYIVVHDDEQRRIRPYLLPEGLPVVSVRDPAFRTDTPFDWIQVIDGAQQLHAIDSCFLMMADMLCLRCRKYCHAYTNPTAAARSTAHRDVIAVWS